MIKAIKFSFSFLLKHGDKNLLKYGLVDCRKNYLPIQLQSKELIDISNQFNILCNSIGNFDDYENLSNKLITNVETANIAEMSKILIQYNVLDLNVWKKLIDCFSNEIEQITIDQVLVVVKNINNFVLNKFRIEQPKHFKYYYKEQELSVILNERQLVNILNKIKFDNNTKNDYINIVGNLLQLFMKLSRTQNVSFYEIYNILENKLSNIVENDLNDILLQQLVILYQIFGFHQNLSKQLAQAFQSFNDQKQLIQIIEIWKYFGSCDEQVLQVTKPQIIKLIQNNFDQYQKLKSLQSLIYANIKDEELLKVIEKQFNLSFELFQRMNYHQQNGYLICQKILKIRNPNLQIQQFTLKPNNKNFQQKKSQQELQLIQYLKYYLQDLNEEATIKVDEKCFLYLIDIALYFKDKKIAFELSGSVYYKNNILIGKKQVKKEILISEGWIPIFMSNTDQNLFNNFSFQNQKLPEKVEQLFDEIFERALDRKIIKK